jgi:hypothetical protein
MESVSSVRTKLGTTLFLVYYPKAIKKEDGCQMFSGSPFVLYPRFSFERYEGDAI